MSTAEAVSVYLDPRWLASTLSQVPFMFSLLYVFSFHSLDFSPPSLLLLFCYSWSWEVP